MNAGAYKNKTDETELHKLVKQVKQDRKAINNVNLSY